MRERKRDERNYNYNDLVQFIGVGSIHITYPTNSFWVEVHIPSRPLSIIAAPSSKSRNQTTKIINRVEAWHVHLSLRSWHTKVILNQRRVWSGFVVRDHTSRIVFEITVRRRTLSKSVVLHGTRVVRNFAKWLWLGGTGTSRKSNYHI